MFRGEEVMALRDLKPENFLYLDTSDESHIKLIDFGLAKIFKTSNKDGEKLTMSSRVGTVKIIGKENVENNLFVVILYFS